MSTWHETSPPPSYRLRRLLSLGLVSALLLLMSCSTDSATNNKKKGDDMVHTVTEEHPLPEMKLTNQPISSYWFPSELLEWKASEDPDLAYNISHTPLAARVDRDRLDPINLTQNTDTNLMSISIMNSSTSGNAPSGYNNVKTGNPFSYWQYVDTLVYWGGSSGEGLIVPPSPDVTDAAHKNGVAVFGTIFFPQTEHGGKMAWLEDFFTQDAAGNFLIVEQLAEVAQTYGFDGWFINQETQGTDTEPLTPEHAKKMIQLIEEFQTKFANIDLVYYDSMTKDGKMDWQNALTHQNLPFLASDSNVNGADEMFLNFWWNTEERAGDQLLQASQQAAAQNGVDPYALYAGIDLQSEGYMTPVRWDLFEKSDQETFTSLGLYAPSWAYYSASDMEDNWNKENRLWVNGDGDPAKVNADLGPTDWRGVSHYITERSPMTSLPFRTNFSLGSGYSFFKHGEQISKMDWSNRGVSDVMPTYRYRIDQPDGNELKAQIDVANAYYGGNSIKWFGPMQKNLQSKLTLYSADLAVNDAFSFDIMAKATEKTTIEALITTEDGAVVTLKGNQLVGSDWTQVSFKTAPLKGKTIKQVGFGIASDSDAVDYQFNLGHISMTPDAKGAKQSESPTVSNVQVESTAFDEDALYAGVRLTWEVDRDAPYYEVYQKNQDGSLTFLAVSNRTNAFLNALTRADDTNRTTFVIFPIQDDLQHGTSGETQMEWPDNSLPKPAMVADVTMIAPGETVTFTSRSSENATEISWNLPGSDQESQTGTSVTATYPSKGVYSVTVTAKNESGTESLTYDDMILVTSRAKDGLELLSRNKETTASSYVNDAEAPPFAVDGDLTKKWCATGTPPHELIINLGEKRTVSAIHISHAEAGGENPDMNTKAYSLYVSMDGVEFTEVLNVTRNSDGVTKDAIAPVEAQYVKLMVHKPTQGSDTAARIYEVEVFGK